MVESPKPDPVHLVLENISVGAKHDRNQYGIITNNLYAVMLRPLHKPDAPARSGEIKIRLFIIPILRFQGRGRSRRVNCQLSTVNCQLLNRLYQFASIHNKNP
ncbi:hypothetical protein [Microcoleus sp. CAWBG58]|uniref:hypothetical protein n=1 Tax=Microcoleus sp. CAWBG58 TaxID=2841651 RepID=UPI0025FD47CD|nr:hypothetical protein [Microcoleus sp. CAWBG58]